MRLSVVPDRPADTPVAAARPPEGTRTSRERLVGAATELFLAGSFHKVGIAEICAKAQINKGTFYHFFPSKLDLLIEVIDDYVRDVAARYEEIARSTETPERKLRSLFLVPQRRNEAWKAVHGSAPGCFLGSIILELSASEPLVREKARWAVEQWKAAMRPVIAAFLAAEGIRHLDEADAAEALIGIVQGANVIAKLRNDPSVMSAFGVMAAGMLRAMGRD